MAEKVHLRRTGFGRLREVLVLWQWRWRRRLWLLLPSDHHVWLGRSLRRFALGMLW